MDSKHLVFFTVAVLAFTHSAFSQKNKTVSGSAEVRIEMNMTEEQTRAKALEQAMIKAIENEFGTYVEQSSDLVIQNGSHTFTIIGTTRVKGDWIETIGEPEFEESTKHVDGKNGDEIENWIKCTVKGKARKAVPKAMLEVQTLNCPQIECRAEDFITGESFYLQFKSPVDGYLSVFLSDGATVYRLLPYSNMDTGLKKAVPVQGDKNYIFFSKNKLYFNAEDVDEIELFTYLKREINSIYIVFAEEPYSKPILGTTKNNSDYKDGYVLPESLSLEKFNSWLSENKAFMDSFQVKVIKIEIFKK